MILCRFGWLVPLVLLLLWHCSPSQEQVLDGTDSEYQTALPPSRGELARSNLITLQAHAQTWPNEANIQFFLGEGLRQANQFEAALGHYQKALSLNPQDDEVRIAHAFTLIKLGRWAAARAALEQDLKFFPAETAFAHMLCRILAAAPDDQVRDGVLAAQYIQALVPLGVDIGLAETIAMVWAETGSFDKAILAQQDVLRMAREMGIPAQPHMLANLQAYVDHQPCRSPWPADSPIFTQASFVATAEYGPDPNAPWKKPGLTMQQRLKLVAQHTNPMTNTFMNEARTKLMKDQLKRAVTPEDQVNALGPYAQELLRSGKSQEALEILDQLAEMLATNGVDLEGEQAYWLLRNRALAWLRLGEQENCLENHSSESCLLPIQSGGIHQLERGSRGAKLHLASLLEKFPNDLNARWLYNIAAMTLGEYPQKVPGPWLIDPQRFASEAPMPPYPEVAGALGINHESLAGGSVLEDFDNDGLLDVLASSWGLSDPLFLARNNGDGSFTDKTEKAGLNGITSGLNMVTTDYNNDGYIDVLVLRGGWLGPAGDHPNSLLRNNGDFSFTDVTEEAGLLSFHPTQTAAWFDCDNDGWLDLFIGNESTGMDKHPCQLYRNNGDGSFSEIAARAGLDYVGFVKGVTAGDYDNDGRPDLFLSCMDQPNVLFRNRGSDPQAIPQFEDVSTAAGVLRPISSFPTWFFDYDNDGLLDLFVSDYSNVDHDAVPADFLGLNTPAEHSRLYHNRGDGTFEDRTGDLGLNHVLVGMGANFGDIDDDGFLDLYVGNGTPDLGMLIPNRLFRNNQGNGFLDVTTAGGFGHLQKGHGISFGDIDNDGDTDLLATLGGAYSGDRYRNALFENPGSGNNWLVIKLEGTRSNRAAIGARLTLEIQQEGRKSQIHRRVSSGGSFGVNPLRQHFGLGPKGQPLRLTLFWPGDPNPVVFESLEINSFYKIVEGQGQPQRLAYPGFAIPAATAKSHKH